MSALVFDKSYRRKWLRIRVNREFLCIKQFRPPLCFGASELSKATIPKESLGYWWDVVSGVMLQLRVVCRSHGHQGKKQGADRC